MCTNGLSRNVVQVWHQKRADPQQSPKQGIFRRPVEPLHLPHLVQTMVFPPHPLAGDLGMASAGDNWGLLWSKLRSSQLVMMDPVSTRKVTGAPWMWPLIEYDEMAVTESTVVLSGCSMEDRLASLVTPSSVWPLTLGAEVSWDMALVKPSGVRPTTLRASPFLCCSAFAGVREPHILRPGVPPSYICGRQWVHMVGGWWYLASHLSSSPLGQGCDFDLYLIHSIYYLL